MPKYRVTAHATLPLTATFDLEADDDQHAGQLASASLQANDAALVRWMTPAGRVIAANPDHLQVNVQRQD